MSKLHRPTNLLPHSPPFRISHNDNNTIFNHPLPLFSHTSLPKGGLAFIGGPVSALSFHPNVPGICATAVHNTTNPTHILHKCYEGPAVIQLWHFSLTNNSPQTKCLGLIPHNGDCTFDLKWRPDKSRNLTPNWSGTFAAALGDGSVIVCHLDAEHIPPVDNNPVGAAPRLEPTTIVLRRNNARSPVRVVEWSPDGKRLVVGSANGNVEVYEADSHEACWPSWTIPAQESVISDIRWLSPKLYCTLGMSCVLRLCDVRDPVATLEQNCEGLQGSLSMAMLEPHVAVVGADSGYLRVVRLSAIDQTTAQNPVRRVYLQTSSFRDMRSVSFSGMTVLYTGGSEGILHQVVFPKPLWPLKGACKIEKTRISEKLRWSMDGDGMHLQLNPPPPKEKGKKKRGAVGRETDGAEDTLFGERYKQPIVVTRIAVNAQNNVIAVGIDGGFIAWLPINSASGSHATPVVEEDAHMFSTTHVSTNGHVRQPEETNGDVVSLDPSSSLKNIPFKVKLKKEAKRPVFGPKRKRGRPRKIVIDDTLRTGRREKQTGDDTGANPDTVDAPKNGKGTRAPREETETPTPTERPRKAGKRGRPRKDVGTPAVPQAEVVEEDTIDGNRKPRKRRRTRASDSNSQEEAAVQAKDRQADQALEETVPSQDTEADGGVVAYPHDTTRCSKAPSEPSSKQTKARSSQPEHGTYPGMSIRLRLPIRKPTREKLEPGKKKTLAGESSSPHQPTRKSARRSRSSAKAPSSELPVEPDIMKEAQTSDAPVTPGSSEGVSASNPSEKPSVISPASHSQAPVVLPVINGETTADPPPPPSPPPKSNPDARKRADTAGRRVKLVLRPPALTPAPAASPPAEPLARPDDNPTSGRSEGSASIPVRLRIRKRPAGEMSEPAVGREHVPKRSKTAPQVMDRGAPAGPIREIGSEPKRDMTAPEVMDKVPYSGDVAESDTDAPEGTGEVLDSVPMRSRRTRKPSWRVRGV